MWWACWWWVVLPGLPTLPIFPEVSQILTPTMAVQFSSEILCFSSMPLPAACLETRPLARKVHQLKLPDDCSRVSPSTWPGALVSEKQALYIVTYHWARPTWATCPGAHASSYLAQVRAWASCWHHFCGFIVPPNLELVHKFCYLGDMLSVDGDAELLMQLWRPEFELDGIHSGSWYHCLPIRIYHC